MARAFQLTEGPRESKAKFLRTVARHHREQDRKKIRALRGQIAEVKKRRAGALRLAVKRCRVRRRELAQRIKEFRAAERERVNREVEAMRQQARETCEARKQAIRAAAKSKEERTRETLRAEKALQRELRETERHLKRREKAVALTVAERMRESDDEVERNIEPDLVPIWRKVKRGIKGSERKSRTEAFLQWVEENPGEIARMREKQADVELRALLREQKAAERAARARAKRKRPTKAEIEEYLKDVPF